jgi:uncharacterized protein
VLFFEGNSARLLEDGQGFVERLVAGTEWGGAVVAYRGFDGNGGRRDPEALGQDAWKVYRELRQSWQAPAARVHVVGYSLGTSAVGGLAARSRREPPATITLLAPMTVLETVRGDGTPPERHDLLRHLESFRSPTLLVHGTRDETLPVEGAREIAAQLGTRCRYVERAELGHHDLRDSMAVVDEVRRFIAAH